MVFAENMRGVYGMLIKNRSITLHFQLKTINGIILGSILSLKMVNKIYG